MPDKYKEINIDGETIIMEIHDNKITIGNRFEVNTKVLLNGFKGENRRKIIVLFDFFRNYAPMLSRSELDKGLKCYMKAIEQRCDSTLNAFWNYFDGKHIQPLGKAVFEWRY